MTHTKKRQKVNLVYLKRQYMQDNKKINYSVLNDIVLVRKIPLSCNGTIKDNRHYITSEGLEGYRINTINVLKNAIVNYGSLN